MSKPIRKRSEVAAEFTWDLTDIFPSDEAWRAEYEALKPYADAGISARYISNIDPNDLAEKTKGLDPETTLFIIVSKTFTTLETLTVNDKLYDGLNMQTYVKAADAKSVSDFNLGVQLDEKINFSDMIGVAFDDPKWNDFLSQLTLSELLINMGDSKGIKLSLIHI